MTASTVSPQTIINTMHELKRAGMRTYGMNAAALKFIMDNELVKQTLWPATVLNITEAGYEYIRENEE